MSSLSENKNRFSEVTTVSTLSIQYIYVKHQFSDLEDFAWSRMFLKAILTVFLLGVALTLGEYHNCKDDPVRGLKGPKLDLSILKSLDSR